MNKLKFFVAASIAAIHAALLADVTVASLDPAYTGNGATPISVEADNIWRFPRLAIYPNALTKEGNGVLEVGFLQGVSNPSDYDPANGQWGIDFGGGPASVYVNGGTFSIMATQCVDLAAIVTTPTLHFDASDSTTMTTVEESGETRLSEWRDPVSGKSAVAPYEGNHGGSKPWIRTNALNGKSIVDFGAFVQVVNGQVPHPETGEMVWDNLDYYDLTSSASLKYPDLTMREVFVVLRVKERRRQPFIFGSVYDWVYSFSPVNWGALCASPSAELLNGEWRVDGLKVDQASFVPDQEFHLISISLTGNIGGLNTFTQDRHCRIGGMELAEVVVYDTELGTDERSAIEKHLMAKWLNKPHPHEAATTLGTLSFGSGISPSLEVGRNVTVQYINGTGTFTKSGAGDVTATGLADTITGLAVTGGSLAFVSAGNPLDVMNEASFHIDPSDATTLVKSGANVTRINDVRNSVNRYAETSTYSKAAGPTLVACEETGLNLLDFGTFAYNVDSEQDDSCGMKWDRQEQVFTVFAVIEKKAANDSFLLGSASDYAFHADDGNLLHGNYSYATVRPGGDTDAHWYLDGEAVANPIGTAWPNGLHVITVAMRDTNAINGNKNTGALAGMFAQDRELCRIGGMRYGEVVVFTNSISSAQIKAITGYLMEKWLGSEPDTSGGFQNLSVVAGSSLSYAGDFAIADDATVDIGYAGNGGSGAIDVTGNVMCGQNVAVTVGPDPKGRVAIVNASTLTGTANLSTWTLNGGSPKFSVEGGVLYAELGNKGFMILVR